MTVIARTARPIVHPGQFAVDIIIVLHVFHRSAIIVCSTLLRQLARGIVIEILDGVHKDVYRGRSRFRAGAIETPILVIIVPDMKRPEITGIQQAAPFAMTGASYLTPFIVGKVDVLPLAIGHFHKPAGYIVFIFHQRILYGAHLKPGSRHQAPVVIFVMGRFAAEIGLADHVSQCIIGEGLLSPLFREHTDQAAHAVIGIGGFVAQGIGLQDAIAVTYHEILCYHDLFRSLSLNYQQSVPELPLKCTMFAMHAF